MTKINKDDFEIMKTTVKRKEHPNNWKYAYGKNGNEHKMALLKAMSKLTKDQVKKLSDGTLVMDNQATLDFMQSLLVSDVIGVKDTLYVVKNVDMVNETVEVFLKSEFDRAKDVLELETTFLTKPQIDFGLMTGFAEILWRDSKPYGAEENEEITLLVPKVKPESEVQQVAPTAPTVNDEGENLKQDV